MKKHRHTLQHYAIILLCIMAWGSSYVAIKMGLEGFTAPQAASYRFAVAGVVSLILLPFYRVQLPSWKNLLRILPLSFFGIFVYNISINYFTLHYPPNVVSFVSNTGPVFIIIFSALWLKDSLSHIRWTGVFLCLIGVTVMNLGDSLSFDWSYLGLFIIPVCGALFFVLQKPILSEMKSVHVVPMSIIIGAIMLNLWDISYLVAIPEAPVKSQIAIIYLGLVPTVIGFLLWSYLLSKTTLSRLASPIYLVPSFTILFSILFLDQFPGWYTLAGGSITILGVLITNKPHQPSVVKEEMN